MASGILAGLSAAGAVFLEPSGLDAIGIWLGVIDEPMIVQAAPILGAVATGCGTLSGFTYFFAYSKRQKSRPEVASNNATNNDELTNHD